MQSQIGGNNMKKIISLIMATMLTISMSTTAFACEDRNTQTQSKDAEKAIEVQNTESEPGIAPQALETLYEVSGPLWPSYEGSFKLNSKKNLKIVFKATSDCKIMFYKGNSVIPFKTLNLSGGQGATTYDIKNNCSAGDYSFIFTTNDMNCNATFIIVASEYV